MSEGRYIYGPQTLFHVYVFLSEYACQACHERLTKDAQALLHRPIHSNLSGVTILFSLPA